MATNAMKIGLILSATDKMSRVVDGATGHAEKKLKAMQGIISKIANPYTMLGGAATYGIAEGINKITSAASEDVISQKRLAKEMTNMWGNTSGTQKGIVIMDKMAEKMSRQMGLDKSAIKLTMAKAASFATLSNKTAVMSGLFERNVRAAHDLEALGYGEASNNIIQLSKAMTDPARMAGALRKAGTIMPSDLDSILKTIAKKGKAAGLEEMMRAIERQSKDMAETTATSGQKMKVALNQVAISLGNVFLPNMAKGKKLVTEMAYKFADWIKTHNGIIRGFVKIISLIIATIVAIKLFKGIIAGVKAVMAAANIIQGIYWGFQSKAPLTLGKNVMAMKGYTAAQWLMNTSILGCPIVWLIGIVVALVAGVVLAWKKFAGFRAAIKATWEVIKGFGSILKDFVIERIKSIINGLGLMGKAIGLIFKGKFSEAFTTAKKGVRELSGYDAKMKAMNRASALVHAAPAIFKNKYEAEKAKEQNKTAIQTIRDHRKVVEENSRVSANTNNSNVVHYSPVIHMNGNASDKETFANMLKEHKKVIEGIMRDSNNNNRRLSFMQPGF